MRNYQPEEVDTHNLDNFQDESRNSDRENAGVQTYFAQNSQQSLCFLRKNQERVYKSLCPLSKQK